MWTKKQWLTCASSLLLGALPLGARAIAASAAEDDPTSAAAAEETAADYQAKAEQYKQIGGAGYKTGLVQRAEADAAKYTAIAAGIRAPEPPPALSPEAQHYADLAAQYRAIGGAGYKTGLVQRAEADERAQIQKDQLVPAEPTTPALPCDTTKPAADVGVSCTGPE
jgi:hypothetical protein